MKIRGNIKGLTVISDIADVICDKWNTPDIESDCKFSVDEDEWYKVILNSTDGDTYEDTGEFHEFEDMIVGVEIVDFLPLKK